MQTPILRPWARHNRLSALAALTVSPLSRRLGLYFDLLEHNVATEDFEAFSSRVYRRLGRPLTLCMDRDFVHKSAGRRLCTCFGRAIHIEWLPACAPELNPVEHHTKYDDLAKFVPADVLELGHTVAEALRATRGEQALLQAFF